MTIGILTLIILAIIFEFFFIRALILIKNNSNHEPMIVFGVVCNIIGIVFLLEWFYTLDFWKITIFNF